MEHLKHGVTFDLKAARAKNKADRLVKRKERLTKKANKLTRKADNLVSQPSLMMVKVNKVNTGGMKMGLKKSSFSKMKTVKKNKLKISSSKVGNLNKKATSKKNISPRG